MHKPAAIPRGVLILALLAPCAVALIGGCKSSAEKQEAEALQSCAEAVREGFRKVAGSRDVRFEGKVSDAQALCRGGQRTLQFRKTPWMDWSTYWGAGDSGSFPSLPSLVSKAVAQRGVAGALLDLEYQRVELIKFNLFDNSGTYQQFISSPN